MLRESGPAGIWTRDLSITSSMPSRSAKHATQKNGKNRKSDFPWTWVLASQSWLKEQSVPSRQQSTGESNKHEVSGWFCQIATDTLETSLQCFDIGLLITQLASSCKEICFNHLQWLPFVEHARNVWPSCECSPPGANEPAKLRHYCIKVHQIFIRGKGVIGGVNAHIHVASFQLVSWTLTSPFQHKYGYIRDKRSGWGAIHTQ